MQWSCTMVFVHLSTLHKRATALGNDLAEHKPVSTIQRLRVRANLLERAYVAYM
jgi:hypothetical protein